MPKKWRILIICLLLVISYNIYDSSKVNTHIDMIAKSLSPYNIYEDPYKDISLVGADDSENIKQTMMDLSDSTGVSFTLSYSEPGNETKPKYYWYLQDEKYLNTNTGLNKNIGLKDFNALKEPITNDSKDDYHFNFPLHTYTYSIYPFQLYDGSNLSTQVTVFSEPGQKLDEFINGLETKGIMHIEEDSSFKYARTFLDTLKYIIFQNPLAPLTFALFLIVIFAFIYQDRRNLSIKLVNGYSKSRYILDMSKVFLWLQAISLIGGFMLFYLIAFNFDFSHIISMLSNYIKVVLVIIPIVIIFVAIIVYSFTDINQNTYVQGVKAKMLTSYIVALSKFVLGFLICLSLIPPIFQIIDSISVYKTFSEQEDKYSDIYYLSSTGDYLTSMIEKSDQIVEAIKDFDNVIYVQDGYPGEGEEAKYKVVYANDNYIKRQNILDENENPIDPSKKNVVYTKAHNIEGVEYYKEPSGFLCESNDNCLDVETIVVDDDAELTFYHADPFYNDEAISKDFVLVPRSENLFILDFFFIFENNNQMVEIKNKLKGIVDTNSIYFNKIIDNWTRDISIYRDMIISDAIKLVNYLIIIVMLSLIYYQIKFDKVRREFSIYWVNGISKFNYFYADYFSQIVVSGIIVLLVKRLFYPELPFLLTLILIFVFIFIDTISLAVFRHQFYTGLQKNIKGQM